MRLRISLSGCVRPPVCLSVCPSVCPSVRLSVSNAFVNGDNGAVFRGFEFGNTNMKVETTSPFYMMNRGRLEVSKIVCPSVSPSVRPSVRFYRDHEMTWNWDTCFSSLLSSSSSSLSRATKKLIGQTREFWQLWWHGPKDGWTDKNPVLYRH